VLSFSGNIGSTAYTALTQTKNKSLSGTRRACAAREQAVHHTSPLGLWAQLTLVAVANRYLDNEGHLYFGKSKRTKSMEIIIETLSRALSKMFNKTVVNAAYRFKEIQAGAVGDVRLIEGTAETDLNEKLPYKLVIKTQKKWSRQDDPDSWRREYDLYSSELDCLFTDTIRHPKCYHAEITDTETRLWLEYLDGVTALNLTCEMHERIAAELGRFQGKLYAEQPFQLQSIANLSKTDCFKNAYIYFKSLKLRKSKNQIL